MKYLEKKKLAFMSIVNQIKGFVRNVSGIPPLTLPDCVDEDSLITYTIKGNSVQNGTPTPDAPVEVESVGDKTKNLLKLPYTTDNRLVSSKSLYYQFSFDVEIGKTYTFSCKANIKGATGSNLTIGLGYDTTYGTSNLWGYTGVGTYYKYTFTPTKSKVYFYGGVTSTAEYWDFQLEEGSTATEYEPYGYKIPVVCSGKNILNPDLLGYYKGNVEGLYGKWTFIKANTTYKFSIKKIMGCTTYRINCALFDTNKQLIQNKSGAIAYNYPISFSANTGVGWYWTASHMLSMNQDRTELNNLVITFKPSRDMYIAWYLTGGTVTSSCYALEPQIEEGTAKTDYEPYIEPVTTNIYLDEPLRKITNSRNSLSFADYIDYEKQQLVRNIYRQHITSVDNKSSISNVFLSSIDKCPYQTPSTVDGANSVIGYAISNTFKQWEREYVILRLYGGYITSYITTSGAFRVGYTFTDETIDTLEKAQIAIGDGFDVYYALDEPEETPMTLPKLPTIKGTTIYAIGTDVQPSKMNAAYYAMNKE